jgi:hypothetical protein
MSADYVAVLVAPFAQVAAFDSSTECGLYGGGCDVPGRGIFADEGLAVAVGESPRTEEPSGCGADRVELVVGSAVMRKCVIPMQVLLVVELLALGAGSFIGYCHCERADAFPKVRS